MVPCGQKIFVMTYDYSGFQFYGWYINKLPVKNIGNDNLQLAIKGSGLISQKSSHRFLFPFLGLLVKEIKLAILTKK